MITSSRGIEFIKEREGFKSLPYRDDAGWLSIGYGHRMGDYDDDLAKEEPLPEELAEAVLREDLQTAELTVNRFVANHVKINQNQFDALVSLVFNIGMGNFLKSTVLSRLLENDFPGASLAFGLWDKVKDPQTGHLQSSKGLRSRRAAERRLFDEP